MSPAVEHLEPEPRLEDVGRPRHATRRRERAARGWLVDDDRRERGRRSRGRAGCGWRRTRGSRVARRLTRRWRSEARRDGRRHGRRRRGGWTARAAGRTAAGDRGSQDDHGRKGRRRGAEANGRCVGAGGTRRSSELRSRPGSHRLGLLSSRAGLGLPAVTGRRGARPGAHRRCRGGGQAHGGASLRRQARGPRFPASGAPAVRDRG